MVDFIGLKKIYDWCIVCCWYLKPWDVPNSGIKVTDNKTFKVEIVYIKKKSKYKYDDRSKISHSFKERTQYFYQSSILCS